MAIIERMPDFNTEVATQTSDLDVANTVGRIQKRTINIDPLNGNELKGTLHKSAFPFMANDAITGEKRVIVATPQLSSNNHNKLDKAETYLKEKLGLNAVKNGLRQGLIDSSTAEKFLNDPLQIDIASPINYTGPKPFTKSSEEQKVRPRGLAIPMTGLHEILSNKKISRRAFLGVSSVTIAGLALNACIPLPINATEISPTATAGQNEPLSTGEATVVPTPTRPEELSGAGGPIYTPDQMQKITNGEFIEKENQYKDWLKYWSAADNRPFHPGTRDLVYRYLFDGNDALVLLQANGAYGGRTFALPIGDGEFLPTPPPAPKGSFGIPGGLGPLEVSGGNHALAFRDGGLVRVDEGGSVVERLDMGTGGWEVERFANLMPENYLDCKNNLLNPDGTIEGAYLGLDKLLELEQQAISSSKEANIWSSAHQMIGYPLLINAPGFLGISIDHELEDNSSSKIVSCSLMKIGEDEFYVFGVPFRMFPEKNDKITFLHFAVNFKATEKMYYAWDKNNYDIGLDFYNKYVSLTMSYSKIKSNRYDNLDFSLINGLVSNNPPEEYWGTTMQLHDKAVEKGFYKLWRSEEGKTSQEIQKIILSCVDIRVDPRYPR